MYRKWCPIRKRDTTCLQLSNLGMLLGYFIQDDGRGKISTPLILCFFHWPGSIVSVMGSLDIKFGRGLRRQLTFRGFPRDTLVIFHVYS